MIRVLHIVTRMDRGGLETFIMNVYRRINRDKVQFDFLTHSKQKGAYDDEIQSLGGKIYTVKSRRESYIGNRRDLDSFFRNHHEFQIVHMHESSMAYVTPLVFAKRHGVKNLILHSRNNNITSSKVFVALHKVNQFRYRNLMTERYAISEEAAIWMFGKTDYQSGKVTIVKNGVEPYQFAYNETYRERIRNELGIRPEHILIGNVGRMSIQKNQLFLLKVFVKLREISNQYKLMIIGDGNEREHIREFIDNHNLRDDAYLLSNRPNVNQYYSAFDFFVLPSLFEGFGRVLLEAQCNGLTCFASKGVIAQEVKVLPSFQFIDLDSMNSWVAAIHKMPPHRKANPCEYIIQSGYDIKETTAFLERRYLEMASSQAEP